jgi:hypothetical protein
MTRAQRLQLQQFVHDIDASLAADSYSDSRAMISRRLLEQYLIILKGLLENSLENNLNDTPLRQALRHIRSHHPEVNTVLAVYQFRDDRPAGCPYYLSLNALYHGT